MSKQIEESESSNAGRNSNEEDNKITAEFNQEASESVEQTVSDEYPPWVDGPCDLPTENFHTLTPLTLSKITHQSTPFVRARLGESTSSEPNEDNESRANKKSAKINPRSIQSYLAETDDEKEENDTDIIKPQFQIQDNLRTSSNISQTVTDVDFPDPSKIFDKDYLAAKVEALLKKGGTLNRNNSSSSEDESKHGATEVKERSETDRTGKSLQVSQNVTKTSIRSQDLQTYAKLVVYSASEAKSKSDDGNLSEPVMPFSRGSDFSKKNFGAGTQTVHSYLSEQSRSTARSNNSKNISKTRNRQIIPMSYFPDNIQGFIQLSPKRTKTSAKRIAVIPTNVASRSDSTTNSSDQESKENMPTNEQNPKKPDTIRQKALQKCHSYLEKQRKFEIEKTVNKKEKSNGRKNPVGAPLDRHEKQFRLLVERQRNYLKCLQRELVRLEQMEKLFAKMQSTKVQKPNQKIETPQLKFLAQVNFYRVFQQQLQLLLYNPKKPQPLWVPLCLQLLKKKYLMKCTLTSLQVLLHLVNFMRCIWKRKENLHLILTQRNQN